MMDAGNKKAFSKALIHFPFVSIVLASGFNLVPKKERSMRDYPRLSGKILRIDHKP